jgi:hypothetical protein
LKFTVTRSPQADASWFEIGVLTEAITGQGILHQIGLGTLLSQG